MFTDEKLESQLQEKLNRIVKPYLKQLIFNAHQAGATPEKLKEVLALLVDDNFEQHLSKIPDSLEDITRVFQSDKTFSKWLQLQGDIAAEDLAQLKQIVREEIKAIDLNTVLAGNVIDRPKAVASDEEIRMMIITERRKLFPAQQDPDAAVDLDDRAMVDFSDEWRTLSTSLETGFFGLINGHTREDILYRRVRNWDSYFCCTEHSNSAFEESMAVFKENFVAGDDQEFEELKQRYHESFKYFRSLFNVTLIVDLAEPKRIMKVFSNMPDARFLENLENALNNQQIRPLIFWYGDDEKIRDRDAEYPEILGPFDAIQLWPRQRSNLVVCLQSPAITQYLKTLNASRWDAVRASIINCAHLEVDQLDFVEQLLAMPDIQTAIQILTENRKLDLTSLQSFTPEKVKSLIAVLKDEILVNFWLKCENDFLSLFFVEQDRDLENFKQTLAIDEDFKLLNSIGINEWHLLFEQLSRDRADAIIDLLLPMQADGLRKSSLFQQYMHEYSASLSLNVLLLKDLPKAEMERLNTIVMQYGYDGDSMKWSANFSYICKNFLQIGKLDFKDMLDHVSAEDWENIVFSKETMLEEELAEYCSKVYENAMQSRIQQEKSKQIQSSIRSLTFLRDARLKYFESPKQLQSSQEQKSEFRVSVAAIVLSDAFLVRMFDALSLREARLQYFEAQKKLGVLKEQQPVPSQMRVEFGDQSSANAPNLEVVREKRVKKFTN